MSLADVQQLAQTCLAANATFAALDGFLELDPLATAADLAVVEDRFKRALQTRGLAYVIAYPGVDGVRQLEAGKYGSGRAELDLVVSIAICENEEINRGPADPAATPPIVPTGLNPSALLELAARYLLREFRLAEKPIGRPEFEDGFWAHTLIVTRRHAISRA